MHNLLQAFLRSEVGAITVDWVILSAAIIGLGIPMLMMAGLGTNSLTERTSDAVAETQVGYTASK